MINMHEVDGTSPHWNLTFLYNYLKASDCKFSSMSLSSRTSYSGKEWFYPAHPHPVLDVFDNSQIDHQTISCLFQSSQMLSTWSNREGICEVLATSMIWRREMTGSHLTVMWFPGNRWRIYKSKWVCLCSKTKSYMISKIWTVMLRTFSRSLVCCFFWPEKGSGARQCFTKMRLWHCFLPMKRQIIIRKSSGTEAMDLHIRVRW